MNIEALIKLAELTPEEEKVVRQAESDEYAKINKDRGASADNIGDWSKLVGFGGGAVGLKLMGEGAWDQWGKKWLQNRRANPRSTALTVPTTALTVPTATHTPYSTPARKKWLTPKQRIGAGAGVSALSLGGSLLLGNKAEKYRDDARRALDYWIQSQQDLDK